MKTTNSTLLQAENQEFVPSLIVDNLKRQEKPAQDSQKTEVNKQPPKKNDSGGFAGFKSGFLMSSTSKKKKQQSKPEFIKPKKQEKADNPLVMNDVQEAMKEEFGSEEFLKSYDKKEKLLKQMANPKFAKAIDFMAKDPEGGKKYYMDHDRKWFEEEFIKFFGDNMNMMGAHIDKAAKRVVPQEKPIKKAKSADERKMEDILSRPAVRAALSNPAVQEIVHLLKTDPAVGTRKLPSLSNRSKKDLEVLVDNGILQMQP
ncbi:unnamed protein product [Oikopleura dioica]|uniref:STI1/HOP DP domain-containing protein n=1 Tax=Oikopleura dioica TaxID=34765 RepID=E4YI48_OIKDI|nr:unnamed protein product [Oikopleura dioica]